MIVGGQTEARAQLSSTIIDYHEPFDQGFSCALKNSFGCLFFFLKLLEQNAEDNKGNDR